MSSIAQGATARELVEQAKSGRAHIFVPLLAVLFDLAVIGSGAGSQTVWYVIRATGIVAYVLLALSTVAGLLISSRSLPGSRSRVDAFDIHSFSALLIFGFASIHVVALLLDTYIGFSVTSILVPFTSAYRPVAVAAGILGLYSAMVVYGSIWLRSRIGYAAWRRIHYLSFAAFLLVTLHGIFSGADSGTPWMTAVYAASLLAVGALTLRRVHLSGAVRRAATA